MIPRGIFGRTGLQVTRIALGGYPFGGVNKARGWDPFSPQGRHKAVATVHAALDAGINVIDTAPSYGGGNSESIVGEATERRRGEFTLMTKVGYRGATPQSIIESIESSLERLRTDVIDVIQFHGGMYTDAEVNLILNGGLLDALERLRDRQLVRFIGFTVEEPWTARPLIDSGRFDCAQMCYNLICQSAARHVLNEARDAGLGVSVMRPMTSGMLQRIAHYLAPEWDAVRDLYEVALKFVLSDSRVHVAIVGMRNPEEVARNAALAESFRPQFDVADLPRSTADVYRTDDEMHAHEQDDSPGR